MKPVTSKSTRGEKTQEEPQRQCIGLICTRPQWTFTVDNAIALSARLHAMFVDVKVNFPRARDLDGQRSAAHVFLKLPCRPQ